MSAYSRHRRRRLLDGRGHPRMNRMYRRQRYIYNAPAILSAGQDQLITGCTGAGATVLEIGCGTGRNLVLAARLYPRRDSSASTFRRKC